MAAPVLSEMEGKLYTLDLHWTFLHVAQTLVTFSHYISHLEPA